jgi:hypothetical protein
VRCALVGLLLLASCNDPPKKRGTVIREPIDIANAATFSVSQPPAADPTPIERYLATHQVSDGIGYALRSGTLMWGMDQEQVLLVIDRRQIIGARWVSDRRRVYEAWDLRDGERWERLFFDRGRLRGWRTWQGSLEMRD